MTLSHIGMITDHVDGGSFSASHIPRGWTLIVLLNFCCHDAGKTLKLWNIERMFLLYQNSSCSWFPLSFSFVMVFTLKGYLPIFYSPFLSGCNLKQHVKRLQHNTEWMLSHREFKCSPIHFMSVKLAELTETSSIRCSWPMQNNTPLLVCYSEDVKETFAAAINSFL